MDICPIIPFIKSVIIVSMQKIKIEQHGFKGILWIGAWLFTLGFLKLSFGKGLLALFIWPYYLGLAFNMTH